MRFKAALFDLDGTLLDTLEDLADTANRVLADAGLPTHPVAAYRYFVGDGLSTLIQRILPDDHNDEQKIKELSLKFKAEYKESWNGKTCIYTGITTMLDSMAARGMALCVLSNKPDEFTKLCVNSLLGKWDFASVLGQREGLEKKPDPAGAIETAKLLGIAPADWLYLGDTATDMHTAIGAGMYPVGALWGFREADELRQAGAETLVQHPHDVLELL